MEKKDNDSVVFYGPLPVSKPCPILKPNDRIQLQPTIHPVAITPYISLESDEDENPAMEDEVVDNNPVRASARVTAVLYIIFSVAIILLFSLSCAKTYPIQGAPQLSLKYFIDMFKYMFDNKVFSQFSAVFAPYLIAVGLIAILVNFVLSMISVITGRRVGGYTLFSFITFITFVIASFYEMHFFSQIKNISNLLDRPCGWPCVMLIIIACVNMVLAFICSMICPKHKVVETVEF